MIFLSSIKTAKNPSIKTAINPSIANVSIKAPSIQEKNEIIEQTDVKEAEIVASQAELKPQISQESEKQSEVKDSKPTGLKEAEELEASTG